MTPLQVSCWRGKFLQQAHSDTHSTINLYPVLCPKVNLIQPTWSAYLYHLVFLIWYPHSLVFLIWYPCAVISAFPCFPYMVPMCRYFLIWQYCPLFWVWRCYGLLWTLHCPKDRYCDVTMIWPLLICWISADVSETPDNALTTWMHGDYRLSIDRFFVGFNAICCTFLRNNLIYIEGHNCRLSTVPGLFNKCSGLRPSDTLSSRWLDWRRHARVG